MNIPSRLLQIARTSAIRVIIRILNFTVFKAFVFSMMRVILSVFRVGRRFLRLFHMFFNDTKILTKAILNNICLILPGQLVCTTIITGAKTRKSGAPTRVWHTRRTSTRNSCQTSSQSMRVTVNYCSSRPIIYVDLHAWASARLRTGEISRPCSRRHNTLLKIIITTDQPQARQTNKSTVHSFYRSTLSLVPLFAKICRHQ